MMRRQLTRLIAKAGASEKPKQPTSFTFEDFRGEGVSFPAKFLGFIPVKGPRGQEQSLEAIEEAKNTKKAIQTSRTRKHVKALVRISVKGLHVVEEKANTPICHNAINRITAWNVDSADTEAFAITVKGEGGLSGKQDDYACIVLKSTHSNEILRCLKDLMAIVFQTDMSTLAEQGNQVNMLTPEGGVNILQHSPSNKPNTKAASPAPYAASPSLDDGTQKWKCYNCTFNNSVETDLCDMCGCIRELDEEEESSPPPAMMRMVSPMSALAATSASVAGTPTMAAPVRRVEAERDYGNNSVVQGLFYEINGDLYTIPAKTHRSPDAQHSADYVNLPTSQGGADYVNLPSPQPAVTPFSYPHLHHAPSSSSSLSSQHNADASYQHHQHQQGQGDYVNLPPPALAPTAGDYVNLPPATVAAATPAAGTADYANLPPLASPNNASDYVNLPPTRGMTGDYVNLPTLAPLDDAQQRRRSSSQIVTPAAARDPFSPAEEGLSAALRARRASADGILSPFRASGSPFHQQPVAAQASRSQPTSTVSTPAAQGLLGPAQQRFFPTTSAAVAILGSSPAQGSPNPFKTTNPFAFPEADEAEGGSGGDGEDGEEAFVDLFRALAAKGGASKDAAKPVAASNPFAEVDAKPAAQSFNPFVVFKTTQDSDV